MTNWAKSLVVLLLVVFAAGTAVQSAQATTMDIMMSTMADGSVGGCDNCPNGSGDAGANCAAGCVAPASGLSALTIAFYVPALVAQRGPIKLERLSGLRPPPDPYPPKQ